MFLIRKIALVKHVTTSNAVKLNFSQYRELRKLTRTANPFGNQPETSNQPTDQTAIEETRPQKGNVFANSSKYERKVQPIAKQNEEQQVGAYKEPSELKTYVPTFNLAAYVEKSPSLQEFLKLGVNLHKIERRKGLAEFVLKLDFEKDVKPHLIFLNDVGVPADQFGELITKNPLLFKEDLDHLQTRINYLEAKKFSREQIARIVTHNPYWLMFSTRRIDRRLGFFQDNFKLTGDDVRFLVAKQPRLITYKMEHIRKSMFTIKEEMGFDEDELKCLLLNKPRLWMMKSDEIVERFAYAHKKMKLSHDMILLFPEVLISRQFRIKQRHEFLQMLGKAQYDPQKDLYISPKALVEGEDRDFVINVAKSDMIAYDAFLRTI